jgi:hypothetical protein
VVLTHTVACLALGATFCEADGFAGGVALFAALEGAEEAEKEEVAEPVPDVPVGAIASAWPGAGLFVAVWLFCLAGSFVSCESLCVG